MTHDPLCPLSRDDCWNAEPPSVCCCTLIARVREDERGKPSEWITPRLHTERMRENYDIGYAAALRDAVEAVKALDLQSHYRMTCEPPDPVDWSKHRSCDAWAEIVAAIKALGGESWQ